MHARKNVFLANTIKDNGLNPTVVFLHPIYFSVGVSPLLESVQLKNQ